MPKSNLDWLGVVSLWVGAIIMAIRAGGLPLLQGAPLWLAGNFWNYIPAILVSFYLIVALYRHFAFHPVEQPAPKDSKAAPSIRIESSSPAQSKPRFSASSKNESKWHPNTSAQDAARYLASLRKWRRSHYPATEGEVVAELLKALYSGRLTGWAKIHPDDDTYFQVQRAVWNAADLQPQNNYAFFPLAEVSGYDVQFATGELKAAYPPE